LGELWKKPKMLERGLPKAVKWDYGKQSIAVSEQRNKNSDKRIGKQNEIAS